MPVYFSGRALTPYETSHIKFLIEAIWVHMPEVAVGLKNVTFFVKPERNTFTTTKGFSIYLSSDFFKLTHARQKELLVHEFGHTIRQHEAGLTWWLARYLASPWFRLDEEIAAEKNEWLWNLRALGEKYLPDSRSLWTQATGWKDFYKLYFISVEKIANKLAEALAEVKKGQTNA